MFLLKKNLFLPQRHFASVPNWLDIDRASLAASYQPIVLQSASLFAKDKVVFCCEIEKTRDGDVVLQPTIVQLWLKWSSDQFFRTMEIVNCVFKLLFLFGYAASCIGMSYGN